MLARLIRKALKSACRYKVAALGINDKGDIIGFACNSPRFCKEGGSLHAEIALMKKYGKRIKTIYICRVNPKGAVLPIHACRVCKDKADKLGIKILSVEYANVTEKPSDNLPILPA